MQVRREQLSQKYYHCRPSDSQIVINSGMGMKYEQGLSASQKLFQGAPRLLFQGAPRLLE